MPNRGLLRRQIRKTWADTIRSAYMDQVISSERALQVHFASRLMDIFCNDGVNRRVFVEPLMQLETGNRVHPDLLICNSRSIIGVVELKYLPKVKPTFEKDFITFEKLAAHGTNIEILNRRYRGPDQGGGQYAMNTNPMYVWAGVYRGPIRQIPAWCPENFQPNQLLVLHAATKLDSEPEIAFVSGKRTTFI